MSTLIPYVVTFVKHSSNPLMLYGYSVMVHRVDIEYVRYKPESNMIAGRGKFTLTDTRIDDKPSFPGKLSLDTIQPRCTLMCQPNTFDSTCIGKIMSVIPPV